MQELLPPQGPKNGVEPARVRVTWKSLSLEKQWPLVEEYSQNKPWSGGDSENKASVLTFLLSKHLLSLCISWNQLEAWEPRNPIDVVYRGHLREEKPGRGKLEIDLESPWKRTGMEKKWRAGGRDEETSHMK